MTIVSILISLSLRKLSQGRAVLPYGCNWHGSFLLQKAQVCLDSRRSFTALNPENPEKRAEHVCCGQHMRAAPWHVALQPSTAT